MANQDRTGSAYEQLMEASVQQLGYVKDAATGSNYLHPPKRKKEVVIEGTYIQPDIVLRKSEDVVAVLYVTHWSNTRSSKYKFWRTWEEAAQQKLAVGSQMVTINCLFEALPRDTDPILCRTSDDLPVDSARQGNLPIQLNGWDPGIGWAMCEAFDINLIFPVGYQPAHRAEDFKDNEHDAVTTQLLSEAISKNTKIYYSSLWRWLSQDRERALGELPVLRTTRSRWRIGLLHLYLFHRVLKAAFGDMTPPIPVFIPAMAESGIGAPRITKLLANEYLSQIDPFKFVEVLKTLTRVYVRKGKKPVMFCSLEKSIGGRSVRFNPDLGLCLLDLRQHVNSSEFLAVIENTFERFDRGFGVHEALQDIADNVLVKNKEIFVRNTFLGILESNNLDALRVALLSHCYKRSPERKAVCDYENQNWVFEMLLLLAHLNSTEDIQKRFKSRFEKSGHKLRPHAPYGGHAQTVAFLLQGRDICEQWSPRGKRRTLGEGEFRRLAWETVSECVFAAFQDRGRILADSEEIISAYLQSKSMRIISSELNGFHVMIEHYLGDLCVLNFSEDAESSQGKKLISSRVRTSFLTEIVNGLWGGQPLTTFCEGVSSDGNWVIKVQSAQDGNEGHKTKELAGRSRAMGASWFSERHPEQRKHWSFGKRSMPKRALVLDGDWDEKKKRNLYEAGWDWVGDVGELGRLRKLIQREHS